MDFPSSLGKAHAVHQMFTHPEARSLPPRGKKGGQQLLILPCLAEERSPSCVLHSVEPLQCSEQADLQEQLENSRALLR